ncbi:MAG TPA: hypothetical protein VLY21_01285 [Nitrososphaerales archaeon]|nr:hypothetical protein [Nitrososphaerales archaeon]
MDPVFPAQFFLLLGIDIFLGGSIITVIFDEHFPNGLPYIMDFGAVVGFVQLVLGPQYLTGYPTDVQFYYCTAYATIAVLAVVGSNLFVVFVRRRARVGGVFAIAGSLPSALAVLYFASAYVNGVAVMLPTIPFLGWPVVWGAFLGATAILLVAMVIFARGGQAED